MTQHNPPLPEDQMGPAERMLDVVLNSSAHLWHNRPGINIGGVWHARRGRRDNRGIPAPAGLFVPAATNLYQKLLEIYKLNPQLMAHFAGYALLKTDWRDLKVAACALMLVQDYCGLPVREDDGSVAFSDDDYRNIGEAMLLHYQRNSPRMMTPKAVWRVAQLLESPLVAALNRNAGFGDPAANKPPLGRWKKAACRWLAMRESNLPMLQGLVASGYKETIKNIARKVGYRPQSDNFFAVLGWKQKQSPDGHRQVGLFDLRLQKRARFDGLSEAEICETVVAQNLKYKEVVGRLPKAVGMTPAIMVALLPGLSDRDIRQLTPTLEELGLLADQEIRARWEQAVRQADDQRALNIAKNVRSKALKEKLQQASDHAVRHAVAEVSDDVDLQVMFLIDKSSSMQGAIEQSKEALSRIVAGFSPDKVHVATFDTMGTVLKPKVPSRTAVQHMLQAVKASGGTMHSAAVQALHRQGVRVAPTAKLVVIVVGDEAGEHGRQFAQAFGETGYRVDAMALLVNVAWSRGNTVRQCAAQLRVPFSEVAVDQFDDPYQVPRVLKALLDAPRVQGSMSFGLVERVMNMPLLCLNSE